MFTKLHSPRFMATVLAVILSLFTVTRVSEAQTNQTATNTSRRMPSRPRPDVRYEHGADSKRKEGVPRGKITDHIWKESKAFPGTIRHYSIYVPAQYDSTKPAAL